MANETQTFYHKEFGEIGVIVENDKFYFPATKCAEILGYTNPHAAVIRHCVRDGLAAITSRMTKKVLPTHVFLPRKKSGLPTDSIVLMEQLHTIDKSRLYMFVCHLDHSLSSAIDRALICSLGIDNGQGEEYGHVF